MDRISNTIRRMAILADSGDEGDDFWGAVDLYRNKFNGLPTIVGLMGLGGMQKEMARVLRKAVEDEKPLNDTQWYKELGVTPPPDEALV